MLKFIQNMGMKKAVIIFAIFSVFIGCSLWPWGKRSPYSREELARIADKEVYIIDGERYIKVPAENERGFCYVKVDEYLAGKVTPLPLRYAPREKGEREGGRSGWERAKETPPLPLRKKPFPLPSYPSPPYLKKKIAIFPFQEKTTAVSLSGGEVARMLAATLMRRAPSVQVIDYEVVKKALEKLPERGRPKEELKGLGRALGVQAVIMGEMYGPFEFSIKEGDEEKKICYVELRLRMFDTIRGRLIGGYKLTNPLLKAEGGAEQAVAVAIEEGVKELKKVIERMGWYSRVALVEGEVIYLLAGSLSGLKEGDVLEVYSPDNLRRPKGQVRVIKLFGIDSSMAEKVKGEGIKEADLVRFPSGA